MRLRRSTHGLTSALRIGPLVVAVAMLGAPTTWAQAPGAAANAPVQDELILTVTINEVPRGELTLVRTADGDFWLSAADLTRLRIRHDAQSARTIGSEPMHSLRALGGQFTFDPAELTLVVTLPADRLPASRIDMANRPSPATPTAARFSGILNYRASVRQSGPSEPVQLRLTTELNVRAGEWLWRQEARADTGSAGRTLSRGATQLVWDDRAAGRRVIAGDQISPGGAFGAPVVAAGLSVSRQFAITPDLIRQPLAGLQITTQTPSEVEVAVDGNVLHRARVGPGPVAIENLFYGGGARTVRVTVIDASGRRQVYEQPFLFTDSVLAAGLHEYGYFVGRRAAITSDESRSYQGRMWQGYHRYGASDALTLQAGGEGDASLRTLGVGATLRSDRFGLLALDLSSSSDLLSGRRASGVAARYTYIAPNATLFASQRRYDEGYRTLATTPASPQLLSESRVGVSARLHSRWTMSADIVRGRDTLGPRDNHALRLSTYVTPRVSAHAEYQAIRTGEERAWSMNFYLRFDLDRQRWASASMRSTREGRSLDIDTGTQVPQGEGVGWRAGVSTTHAQGQDTAFGYGSLNWNLRPATVELNTIAQVRGGRSHFIEAGLSGAVVALPGFVGMTRQVSDSFALAELGVPQAGVDVSLNSQLQGRTDAQGRLLIPQVGAFGRQDVSIDDKQVPMEIALAANRVTISPPYKSGVVVSFAGRRIRAITGKAWLLQQGRRTVIASRALQLDSPAGPVRLETTQAGEFYLENITAGRLLGRNDIDGKAYSCRLDVTDSQETVQESEEGLICE